MCSACTLDISGLITSVTWDVIIKTNVSLFSVKDTWTKKRHVCVFLSSLLCWEVPTWKASCGALVSGLAPLQAPANKLRLHLFCFVGKFKTSLFAFQSSDAKQLHSLGGRLSRVGLFDYDQGLAFTGRDPDIQSLICIQTCCVLHPTSTNKSGFFVCLCVHNAP